MPFSCDRCHVEFKRKRDLYQHSHSKHGIKGLFPCSEFFSISGIGTVHPPIIRSQHCISNILILSFTTTLDVYSIFCWVTSLVKMLLHAFRFKFSKECIWKSRVLTVRLNLDLIFLLTNYCPATLYNYDQLMLWFIKMCTIHTETNC